MSSKNNFHKERNIYMIRNKFNDKKYIGLTLDFKARKQTHLRELRSNAHKNNLLQKEFDHYGEDAFVFSIIKSSPNHREAYNDEKELIQKHNSIKEGYNISGRDSVWVNDITFNTRIKKGQGTAIMKHIEEINTTASQWAREAIMEKAKRDGLI